MKIPAATINNAALLLVVALGAAWVIKRSAGAIVDTAGGILTGDNALTQNATDFQGARVTAYEGAGPLGTLGAATNAASGGILASLGGWIGSAAYNLTH